MATEASKKVFRYTFRILMITLLIFWFSRVPHELGHYLTALLFDCKPEASLINWINPIETPFVIHHCGVGLIFENDLLINNIISAMGLIGSFVILIPVYYFKQLNKTIPMVWLSLFTAASRDFASIITNFILFNTPLLILTIVFYFGGLSISAYYSCRWYFSKVEFVLKERKQKTPTLRTT